MGVGYLLIKLLFFGIFSLVPIALVLINLVPWSKIAICRNHCLASCVAVVLGAGARGPHLVQHGPVRYTGRPVPIVSAVTPKQRIMAATSF